MADPIGPVEGTKVPRFAGAATFARIPEIDRVTDYDVAVLGVPFDSGSSYRPGARFGPMAVRQASRHLRPGHHVELDCAPFSAIQVADAGDVAVTPFSIDDAIGQIQAHATDLVGGGRRVIAIGGDHTVALPLLRSVVREHGPVALVHFDAHLDTWNTYFNAPVTHGTIFRRAFEEGLLVEDHSVHVGIRGPIYDHADLADDTRFGFRTIRASDIDDLGVNGAIEAITARVADVPVYLSVDIDVLEPGTAPRLARPDRDQPGRRRRRGGGTRLRSRGSDRHRRRHRDLRPDHPARQGRETVTRSAGRASRHCRMADGNGLPRGRP
jgi:agmatinase